MDGPGSPASPKGLRSTARRGPQPFAKLCLTRLPPGRVLNVGSGFPDLKSPVHEVVNIDIDQSVLRGAVNAAAADIVKLPFGSDAFNGVILKDVLEHVPDPVGALSEIARVATSDAVVILTVPRAIPRAVWADPTHLRGFTSHSIRWALEMGGWRVQGRIDRIGSIPGAGHFPWLLEHAHQLLRIPVVGHRLGTNWLIRAHRLPDP